MIHPLLAQQALLETIWYVLTSDKALEGASLVSLCARDTTVESSPVAGYVLTRFSNVVSLAGYYNGTCKSLVIPLPTTRRSTLILQPYASPLCT